MTKLILFVFCLFGFAHVQASTLVRVKALGASPKGQYIAVEEFGYLDGDKGPYSRIKILNVWKNKYVVRQCI